MIGMSAVVPFLPLFVRELGVTSIEATANWSGLVFAGPFFLSFFLAPVWGNIGDRYGRKIMILRAIFGLALAQVIIGFSQNVTHLFLARLLQGVLSGFLPAAMALVAANTPEEKTGYALGLLQSATAAGNIFGPLVGGIISDLIGFRNVFFFVAGLLFITGLLVLKLIREEHSGPKTENATYLVNWGYVFRKPVLLLPAILILITSFGFAFVRPIFVLYVETMHIDTAYLPTITGVLYSVMGIFSTISSPWWGKKAESFGLKKSLIIASIITALTHIAHTVIFDPYILVPVRIVMGFGFGALFPLLFTAISRNVVVERRGGVLGVASSFQILGNMLGPVAGGFCAGFFGIRTSFVIAGLIFFLITYGAFDRMREHKKEVAAEPVK
jgi:DHA1 family multidrug resistance protein-like MFS transporter